MRILLLAMALCGCNDPGLNSTDVREEFLGSWVNTSGNVKVVCPGMADQMATLGAGEFGVTIANATALSTVTITLDSPANCALSAAVGPHKATLTADTPCSVSGGTLTIKAGGTFETSDGVTLTARFTHASTGSDCTQENSFVLQKETR